MDALEFLNEFGRMCESFDSCIDCPAIGICDASPVYSIYETDNLIRIISDWSKQHPRKTRLDDFKEKYPNAKLRLDGYPYASPCDLGYLYGCDKTECDYKSCWNEPIE